MDYIMEGQTAKRRRVYSTEPNKVVEAVFTRKYLNYLVPALAKIKERRRSTSSSSAEQEAQHNMIHYCDANKDVVKYEVDMAMVFSAQGFAWSNALKNKLQREEGCGYFVVDNGEEEGSSSSRTNNNYDQNEALATPLPSSKSHYQANKILVSMKGDFVGGQEEEEEDEVMNSQLRSLRRLIPGGEDMCNEQMVAELESYVSCLQMQVNILQYLTGTN